jgi:hypothetical protein
MPPSFATRQASRSPLAAPAGLGATAMVVQRVFLVNRDIFA